MKQVHDDFRPPQRLINKLCEAALSCLEGKHRDVLECRFKGMGQEETAKLLELKTKQYASKLEEEALLKFTTHIRREEKLPTAAMQTPIALLKLPMRAETSLLAAGVRYVEHLVQYSPKEVLTFNGIRKAGLLAIMDALRKRGLHLSRSS